MKHHNHSKILINPLPLAPTSQLQCDTGATPQPSFSIDSSGKFHHNDTTDFVACVSGQSDQLNIYTNPPPADVTGCRPIELNADRCQGAPTQPPSGPPSVPQGPSPGAPPVSIPSPISPPPPVSPPPQPQVSSGAPGPSPSVGPIVPPKVPQPPEGSSSCPITTITQVPPAGPGAPGASTPPGQPAGGHGGPTTPGAPNTPAESSGPRTPSAPGGVPTAPGPPPFANSSAPTPTGVCATGLCPTGKILPTGTSGPGGFAPGAGGGGPSGGGCGTNLINGSFEFPHLIIPIDSSSPNKVAGTSFNGTITSTISSIFNFDFLPSSANKQCSLVFLFPTQDKLETSAFTFSGDGAISFLELQAPASSSTSFSNAPQVKVDFGVTNVSPGHTYTIATFACPAGQTVAFELKNAGSTSLDFFEDFNPAP